MGKSLCCWKYKHSGIKKENKKRGKDFGWCYLMLPSSLIQEATKMAELCQQKLNLIFPNLPSDIRGYKEHPQQAVGSGSGIKYGLWFPFIISVLK